jgi:hypothetical protein
MSIGLSDQIRAFARTKYVHPAVHEGKLRFFIRVRDVNNDLKPGGFPPRHTPQICNALTGPKFLRENGLEIEKVEGPPSGQSTTVVIHYRVANSEMHSGMRKNPVDAIGTDNRNETPEEWANRLTGKLFGLLKDEFAEYGGGEAFLHRIRSEDEGVA